MMWAKHVSIYNEPNMKLKTPNVLNTEEKKSEKIIENHEMLKMLKSVRS